MLNRKVYSIKYALLILGFFAFNRIYSYQITTYTVKEGLSNNNIKGICFDKFGYLWIGTENGLNRFDGKEFKQFSVFNVENGFINENRVSTLYNNKEGHTIAITMNGGTFKTSQNLLTKVDVPITDFHPIFKKLQLNLEQVAHFYSIKIVTNTGYIKFKNNYAEIYEDTSLVETILCPSKSINQINNDDWFFKHCFYFNNELYFMDDELKMYVYSFQKKNWTISSDLTGLKIASTKKKFNVRIINSFGMESPFLVIDDAYYLIESPGNKHINFRFIVDKIKSDDIKSIQYDKHNYTLALSSVSNGIIIVRGLEQRGRFQLIHTNSKRNLIDLDSNILDEKFNLYNLKGTLNRSVINMDFATTLLYYKDKMGRVWFSEQGGGGAYFYTKDKGVKLAFSLKDDYLKYILEDSENRVWLFYNYQGAFIFKPVNGQLELVAKIPQLADVNWGINLKNKILAYTRNYIEYEINTSDLTFKINKLSSKLSGIRSILNLGNDDLLYATYGNGLFYRNKQQIVHLPRDINNSLEHSNCVFFSNDLIVVTTNDGIISFEKKALQNYLQNKTNIQYYTYNWFNDEKEEFNGNCEPCFNQIKDKFILPHISGIAILDTTLLTRPKLKMNDISIDYIKDLNTGKFFTTSDQLIVNHNSKLEFKFVLPYWGNFSNLTFELTIKGRNYNRTFRQNQPVFSIYDITPGAYQISVVAFDGVNKTNYKTMQLRVPTIWYKTRWFIALVVILFVLIIVLSSRIYNNYLIRKNKKLEIQIKEHVKDLENERSNLKTKKDELEKLLQFKDRVVSIISHDLIGPLRFTSTALNNINNDQNQESKSQNIEIVKSNIDNILFQTFELLTWTKFKNDSLKLQLKAIDLHQWINEIIGHFQHTNSNNIYNLVPLNCEVETETKILNIIVFNLIDNAIKYGNGDIKIEYRPKRNQHVLIIKNKGVPMDIDQRKAYNNKDFDKAFDLIKHSTTGGVGLRLCCEIIESINGAIKFPKSSADETTVLVYF